jgi:hypothetical protein
VTTFTNPGCEAGSSGSITVSANGGTGSYTYLWSHNLVLNSATATGLGAGTYTITVTDGNGCTAQVSQILSDPSGITAEISNVTNVVCKGGNTGSATVTGVGGTALYGYLWSNGQVSSTAVNLVAGSYTVTVTDGNGCSAFAFVQITEAVGLLAQAEEVNAVSCFGGNDGSARVYLTGGVTPYSYNWDGTPAGDGTSLVTGLALR